MPRDIFDIELLKQQIIMARRGHVDLATNRMWISEAGCAFPCDCEDCFMAKLRLYAHKFNMSMEE